MSSSLLPNSAIPKPLPDDDDDVSWALQTAAVQWGRGAYQDALVWLRRAAESAIELSAWSRAADLNATATRLEKQLSRGGPAAAPVPSQLPSAPPRHAVLPSFPVPTTSAPPAGSLGPLPGGRHQTTGYSSLPPLSVGDFASQRPSGGASARSSVVIDVEEGELELSDDEIRELESEGTAGSDIPNGARPSWAASPSSQYPTLRRDSNDSLPAFSLESARPSSEATSRRPGPSQSPTFQSELPSFSLDSSARPPPMSTSPAVPSTNPGRASGRSGPAGLPSFPLESTASSLPPVSKWPRLGSPGTSHLPPSPALPTFESAAPSRPFVDDGDDGAPGVEEPVLEASLLEELEPLAPEESTTRRDLPSRNSPPQEALDLVEIDGPRRPRGTSSSPTGLGHLSVRPSRTSPRPIRAAAPLPPALPESRTKSSKPVLVRAERVQPPPPLPEQASAPPTRGSIEPRMPKRTLASLAAAPLDFTARAESQAPERQVSAKPSAGPSTASDSNRVISNAPTIRKLEAAEPISIVPPSARSIEPEDLPTVSSPSLSYPPLPVSVAPDGERADTDRPSIDPRRSSAPYPERKKLSFRFEEPKRPESKRDEPHQGMGRAVPASSVSVRPEASADEEPLAVMPPVTTRPSVGPSSEDVELSGVRLAEVRGFSDLPASAHRMLAKTARIEALNQGEEASFFSVALVLDGWVGLMPAIADNACATAVVGEVVFTEGSLSEGVMLRVVAGQDDVVVATWDSEAIAEATKDCPWVADDLKLLADGFQALAGACLGPLGDRLDDSLRSIVTSRCEIRTLLPGEQLCPANKPVPGMHIIGGGEIELVDENARVTKTHGTGEFLFAPQVLAGGVTPFAARAGSKGALVLFAPRMAAHELLVSVPPLLEILAD